MDQELKQNLTKWTESNLNNETYNPYWQDIIKSYFKANGFVKHQLDSFNEFVEVGIQKILNEVGPIEIKTTKESRGGEATYIFEFGTISIKKPVIREHDGTTNVLYPQEARNRNLTYHSSLYCDVKVKTIKNGEETVKISKEQLGYIPIMVRSKFCLLYNKTEKECKDLGECIYDEGGYFIVNGNEKAIVAQERMPNNIVYCFYKKPPSKIIWQAELRSQFEYHIKTTSTFYIRIFSKGSRSVANSNPTFTDIDGIRGQITYIKQDIPIVFIFYALGFTSKNDIIDIVTNSKISLDTSTDDEYFKNILKFLRCSFDEANEIIKEENPDTELKEEELQEFCLDYIGRKGSTTYGSKAERVKYATQIINRELLPHLNLEYEDIFKPDLQITKTKAHFIGYMINKLYISYLGIMKENDRDHLANKRLDLTGNLLTSLFKGIFKRLYKEAKVNLTKSIEANNSFDLMNNIKSKSITNDIKYALSTGNWGRQTGGTPPKTGVAQQLNRLTFSSGLSHLRRLNTPLNREGKQAKPRQLHATNWAYVCPAETPEGQGCGLLRNLAITCHVSIGSSKTFIILKRFLEKYVEDKFIEVREMVTEVPLYKVFLDGAWVVSVDEKMVQFLVGKLKKFRRKLMISFDTCVCLDKESKELHIFTGPGRFCRPLLVVENLHLLNEETKNSSWNELLSKGIVEYIDIAEEEEIMIAMDLKQIRKDPDETYSHLEIHPSVILGICASIIPFPDHNQSPRNIYQSSMGKQAMGIYASNFNERFDTLAHVLHYPQKPLVTTTFMKYMRFKELPAGINAIVAIACYGGYNQEDSIIVNQGALDRGIFRSTFFKTYVDQEKEIVRVGGLMEQFEVPNRNDTKGIQHGNYGKLGIDGVIEPGSRVIENDIIIGKTTPIATSKQEISQMKKFKKRDVSTSMRQNEEGVIDKVLLTTNSDGFKYSKVKIRSTRTPVVGDKLASRHGQKGTVGMKYRQEDMPFTEEGIVPDLIINPHAIPSRMTIGHLVECLLGKVCTITGKEGDATPFNEVKVDEVAKLLEECGYAADGTEILYNGETGEPMEARIFIGPTYYQRLKHMVKDKEHSRSTGPVTKLTRQPLEGRAKDGGLKLGEMERDVLCSHGAAYMLKDRMFYNSDPYRVHVCKICGTICQADLDKQRFLCKCIKGGNTTEVAQVYLPYACKLFFQELMAMNILPRIKV
jgi:DNA-directed RNA polymerase II subunit RPB2